MESPSTGPRCIYRIDASDHITAVGGDWESFARANQAEDLSADAVVGRPLFDFVSGRKLRHLYALVLQRVRQTQEPVQLELRCDAPGARRIVSLELSPLDKDEIRFEGRVLQESARQDVPLLDRGAPRSEDPLIICSWCKKVEVDADWVEVEEAIATLELFTGPELPALSHGLCGTCTANLRGEIDALELDLDALG